MALTKEVLSRSTTTPTISMWGTLYANATGELAGWVVSTCSGVISHLPPEMHWASKEDGKFYRLRWNIDVRKSLEVREEDTEIEPRRADFIRATLRTWEQEYLQEKTEAPK